jgi:ribose 5-phosphate isomerase B
MRGIRAALVQSADAAGLSRRHNDANVLCFGAKYVDLPAALACVEAFLAAEFEAGRHTRRVDKMESSCG